MTFKGFTENTDNIETPNDINVSEKPLNTKKIGSGRVDINVLKSKLEEQQSKEFRKNLLYGSEILNQKENQTQKIKIFKSMNIRINFLSQNFNFVI